MKIKLTTKKEFEVKFLQVDAGVRYWEDAKVNGEEDEDGTLIPCRVNDRWKPLINIETGIIENWDKGISANTHYKVCDDGEYHLLDENKNNIVSIEGYVPKILDLYRDSYGDYIILNINEDGLIEGWDSHPNLSDFEDEE